MIISTTKTMRPRAAEDFYPTPLAAARSSLTLLPADLTPAAILDPGAGTGVYGQAARELWPGAEITGAELRLEHPSADYDRWRAGDFLRMPWYQTFDLVIGNPPYKPAEQFVRRAFELTRPGGFVAFLLRLAFLEGRARGRGLWSQHPPLVVGAFSRRPSFTGNGRTDATAYAVFVWQIGYHGETVLRWLDYDDDARLDLPVQLKMEMAA